MVYIHVPLPRACALAAGVTFCVVSHKNGSDGSRTRRRDEEREGERGEGVGSERPKRLRQHTGSHSQHTSLPLP